MCKNSLCVCGVVCDVLLWNPNYDAHMDMGSTPTQPLLTLSPHPQARPPGIYKSDYLDELALRYNKGDRGGVATPPRPEWCKEEEEEGEEETRRPREKNNEVCGCVWVCLCVYVCVCTCVCGCVWVYVCVLVWCGCGYNKIKLLHAQLLFR